MPPKEAHMPDPGSVESSPFRLSVMVHLICTVTDICAPTLEAVIGGLILIQ